MTKMKSWNNISKLLFGNYFAKFKSNLSLLIPFLEHQNSWNSFFNLGKWFWFVEIAVVEIVRKV